MPTSKRVGSLEFLSQKISDLDAPLLVTKKTSRGFDVPLTEALLVLAKLHKTQVAKERMKYSAGIPLKKKMLLLEGNMRSNSMFEEEELTGEVQFRFITGPKDDYGRRIRTELRKSETVHVVMFIVAWWGGIALISELGEEVFLRLMSGQIDDWVSTWKILLLPILLYLMIVRSHWFIRSKV